MLVYKSHTVLDEGSLLNALYLEMMEDVQMRSAATEDDEGTSFLNGRYLFPYFVRFRVIWRRWISSMGCSLSEIVHLQTELANQDTQAWSEDEQGQSTQSDYYRREEREEREE
jgi:hypothetical protein